MKGDGASAREAAARAVWLCDTLAELTAAGREEFRDDLRTQWAVGLGLIRIGEAVAKLPASVTERFPDQPWRQIVGMRNYVAHQYDDIDLDLVWGTVSRDIPALREYLVDTVIPGLDA